MDEDTKCQAILEATEKETKKKQVGHETKVAKTHLLKENSHTHKWITNSEGLLSLLFRLNNLTSDLYA